MRKGFEDCILRAKKSSGNYHYEENVKGVIECYYHNTVILAYDTKRNIYFCDDRGWNTSSTHCAMSGADAMMESMGYVKVSVEKFKSITGAPCYAE